MGGWNCPVIKSRDVDTFAIYVFSTHLIPESEFSSFKICMCWLLKPMTAEVAAWSRPFKAVSSNQLICKYSSLWENFPPWHTLFLASLKGYLHVFWKSTLVLPATVAGKQISPVVISQMPLWDLAWCPMEVYWRLFPPWLWEARPFQVSVSRKPDHPWAAAAGRPILLSASGLMHLESRSLSWRWEPPAAAPPWC